MALLSFGMEDFKYGISADETFFNVKTIAAELQRRHIRVGVLTTPDFQHINKEKAAEQAYISKLNELLDDWLDKERETSDSLLLSKSVPRLHSSRSMEYKSDRLYWRDERHLSSAGYERIASDMLSFHGLINVFLKIEYECYKQVFGL